MSNCPQCDENLKKAHDAGSPWNLCTDPNACNDTNYYMHSFCNCTGQFNQYPFVQNGKCMNGPGTLIPNGEYECYCCCSCYSYGMRIAVTDTTAKTIQDLNVNDTVLVAKDASLKTWTEEPVSFSSGTGADASNSFINIHFGDQKTGMHISSQYFVSELITPEQADAYYSILSTAPNNFIGEDGLVNLAMVQQANELVLSELLAVSTQVASWIFAILKLDPNYLMVSRVQPLLMRDGTLKQAEKLVPGKDALVCKDGSATPLISIEISLLEKGVHYIATSLEQATSLDGHLLLSNGIVIGDYATLIAMNTPGNPLEDLYKNDPALGTVKYGVENPRLLVTPTGAYVKPRKPTDDPSKKS
jgi:hypothetical protein